MIYLSIGEWESGCPLRGSLGRTKMDPVLKIDTVDARLTLTAQTTPRQCRTISLCCMEQDEIEDVLNEVEKRDNLG